MFGRLELPVYGQPYHHKPSLLYALIGICYRLALPVPAPRAC
jgi:hypothetical protein